MQVMRALYWPLFVLLVGAAILALWRAPPAEEMVCAIASRTMTCGSQ